MKPSSNLLTVLKLKARRRIFRAALGLCILVGAGVASADESPVILRGSSCDALVKQMQALREWTAKLGEDVGKEPRCRHTGWGRYQIDVSDSVPSFVRHYNGTCSVHDGPNCFDATLCTAHIFGSPTYCSPEEMDFWVNSSLCKEVASGEKPKPGDLIVIRDKQGAAQHGFTYVTDDLSFSKNGYAHTQEFALQPMKDVYSTYGVKPGCEKLSAPDPKCDAYSMFYRCDTLDHYLSTKAPVAKEEVKPILTNIANQECWLSEVALEDVKIPKSYHDTVADSLKIIARWADDEMSVASKSKAAPDENLRAEMMLWKAVKLRTEALQDQLKLIPLEQ